MCHPSEHVDPPALHGARRHEVTLPLDGGEALPARLCVPEGPLRGALVIATDIFGANAFYRRIADRAGAAGFAALLPDLFFREGRLREATRELAYERRAKLEDERALRELESACDWLRERGAIEGRVGTLGFCLGGNLVLHMAARREDLATVSYYAFPAGLPAPKAAPPPESVVDRLHGPILAFWGERDEKVGLENTRRFERAVRATGIAYEGHIYSGCEHGFLAGLEDPDHAAHDAASDSWGRTLEFLGAGLGTPARGIER